MNSRRASTPRRVLIVGLDPRLIPGADWESIVAGLAYGLSRFDESEFAADELLLPLDASAEALVVTALDAARRDSAPYECVVIGGGIRKPEPLLPFFEALLNLVLQRSPGTLIAFNSDGGDSLDAVRRVLSE